MEIVKVYKTDVEDHLNAGRILEAILDIMPKCDPAFDLEDCDNVLRIANPAGEVSDETVSKILNQFGYSMESLL